MKRMCDVLNGNRCPLPSFIAGRFFPVPVMVLTTALTFAGLRADVGSFVLQQNNSLLGSPYNGATDCSIRESEPHNSAGQYGTISAGYEPRTGGGATRILIRFDCSVLQDMLTAHSTIEGARLKLHCASFSRMSMDAGEQTVEVYRVSDDNASWKAGTSPDRSTPEKGAACWSYRCYDNSGYPPGDPREGELRHQQWAGSAGCGTAGVDYGAQPVATGTISAAREGSWVECTINDPAFILSWITTPEKNEGLLVRIPGLEKRNGSGGYATAKFSSADNDSSALAPVLALDIEGVADFNPGALVYDLPSSGNVSIHISDTAGYVVKKLLFAQKRSMGRNVEFWNCKRDPIRLSDTVNLTVPDGKYTVKGIHFSDIQAEFMLRIGQDDGTAGDHMWPGGHSGQSGIAIDREGVFVSCIPNEGAAPHLIKIKRDGTRLLEKDNPYNFAGFMVSDVDDGTFYGYNFGDRIHTLPAGASEIKRKYPSTVSYYSSSDEYDAVWKSVLEDYLPEGISGVNRLMENFHAADMAVNNGTMLASIRFNEVLEALHERPGHWMLKGIDSATVVSSQPQGRIVWLDPQNGDIVGSPIEVTDVCGVTVDNDGNGLVISGNSLRKYTKNSDQYTVLVPDDGTLSSPYRLDVHPETGEIYIGEAMPVKFRGFRFGSNAQVKRFSPAGELLQTYGVAGGREPWGPYDGSAGFGHVGDIAVDYDGSFWVCDMMPPWRLVHFSKDGDMIREFLDYGNYWAHTVPMADDPSEVYFGVGNGGKMYKLNVDWKDRRHTVEAVYHAVNPLETNRSRTNFKAIRRNGKVYIITRQTPAATIIDPRTHEVYPVSSAGNYIHDREIRQVLQQDPEAAQWDIDGFQWGFNWHDKNMDHQWSGDEITLSSYRIAVQSGHGKSGTVLEDGTVIHCWPFTGAPYHETWNEEHPWFDGYCPKLGCQFQGPAGSAPKFMRPRWETIGGVDVPIYEWERREYKLQDPPGMRGWMATAFFCDKEGTVYVGYNTEKRQHGNIEDKHGVILEYYGTGQAEPYGGHKLAAWDTTTGKLRWHMDVRHANSTNPGAGEITRISRGMGVAGGALFFSEVRPHIHVYDTSGLYITNNPLRHHHPHSSGVHPLTWVLCGEQFGGSVYEVPDNTTPGLKKGDVLLMPTAGCNSNPVFRIHGLDNIRRFSTVITVENGKIVAQTDLAVEVDGRPRGSLTPRQTPRIIVTNRTLTYTVPPHSRVLLDAYSLAGRRVTRLVDGERQAGTHSLRIGRDDGANLHAGTYVIRLKAGNAVVTRKISLLR